MVSAGTPTYTVAPRRLWLGYAGACLIAWLLHVISGLDAQRGAISFFESLYSATWALWPPVLLGPLVYPWVRSLDRRRWNLPALLAAHTAGALVFGLAWQVVEFVVAKQLFGTAHAVITLVQGVISRTVVGAVVYGGIAASFTAVIQAQRARQGAIMAAQAEAALAKAELAAISGKLNPHFLFNTLNLVIALTRKDPAHAEQALLQFSSMLRYVLATHREATERVTLEDELEFVRNYLALESLRLGPRLTVHWSLDPQTLMDEIPPLSLQPLVENAVLHGVAPRVEGGSVGIRSERDPADGALHLSVQDDGTGCDPSRLDEPRAPGRTGGIGLSALRKRFALDFEGRARMTISTAPQKGFRVDLWIPQNP